MTYLGFFRTAAIANGKRICIFQFTDGSISFVPPEHGNVSAYLDWDEAKKHIPQEAQLTLIRQPVGAA